MMGRARCPPLFLFGGSGVLGDRFSGLVALVVAVGSGASVGAAFAGGVAGVPAWHFAVVAVFGVLVVASIGVVSALFADFERAELARANIAARHAGIHARASCGQYRQSA
jgi:hypothetical protein